MKQCNLDESNQTLVLLTLTTSNLDRYFKPAYSTESKAIDSNICSSLNFWSAKFNHVFFYLLDKKRNSYGQMFIKRGCKTAYLRNMLF